MKSSRVRVEAGTNECAREPDRPTDRLTMMRAVYLFRRAVD